MRTGDSRQSIMQNSIKWTNMCRMAVFEVEREKKALKKMVKIDGLKLSKPEGRLPIKGGSGSTKRPFTIQMLWHNLVKLLKYWAKEEAIKAAREKWLITHNASSTKWKQISHQSPGARRYWDDWIKSYMEDFNQESNAQKRSSSVKLKLGLL